MFFLLRSAFWLSVVFSAMNWPEDCGPMLSPQTELKAVASQLLTNATSEATKACTASPRECLELASKLHSFQAGDVKAKPTSTPRSVDTLKTSDLAVPPAPPRRGFGG